MPPRAADARSSPGRSLLLRTLLVVLTLAAHAPSLDNGFVYDDVPRILQNPEIRRLWPPWRHFLDPGTMAPVPELVQFRPLVPLLNSLDFARAGASPRAFHLTNLWIHVLVVLLLAELGRQAGRDLSGDPDGSSAPWWGAALFAVHPLPGTAVAYVDARSLSLAMLFSLAALLLHARSLTAGPRAGRLRILAGLAMLLGLFSKEVAALVPALCWLYEVLVRGTSPRDPGPWRRALGYLAVLLAWGAWTRGAAGSDPTRNTLVTASPLTTGPLGNLRRQLDVHVFQYLRWQLRPDELRVAAYVDLHGPWGGAQALGGLAVALSLALAWRLPRQDGMARLGLVGYWLLLAPTSSVLPLVVHSAPYYVYGAMGLWLLGWTALLTRRLPQWAWLPLAVATVGLSTSSSRRLDRIWKDPATLFRHSVRHGGNYDALYNLAVALPDPRDRIPLLEAAIAQEHNYGRAHLELALAHLALGDDREAVVRHLRECLVFAPVREEARWWLGYLHDVAHPEARPSRLGPPPEAAEVLSRRMLDAGRPAEAAPLLADLARATPEDPLNAYYLALAEHQLGRLERAASGYAAFLARLPSHPLELPLATVETLILAARRNRARALIDLGRCPEALGELLRAEQLRPGSPEVTGLARACQGAAVTR